MVSTFAKITKFEFGPSKQGTKVLYRMKSNNVEEETLLELVTDTDSLTFRTIDTASI